MIDTQDKLNAFVTEHRRAILAQAIDEFLGKPETQEDDIWGTHYIDFEEQCDFNTYRPEDENRINVTAYALREMGDGTVQVDTQIGALVADITWKDCEDYLNFGG